MAITEEVLAELFERLSKAQGLIGQEWAAQTIAEAIAGEGIGGGVDGPSWLRQARGGGGTTRATHATAPAQKRSRGSLAI